jgi:hypothetical protein
MALLSLALERGDEGFVLPEAIEVIGAVGDFAASHARFVINHLRKELGHDVLVWRPRLSRYRMAGTPEDAVAWLLRLVRDMHNRANNLETYVTAARARFPKLRDEGARLNDSLGWMRSDLDRLSRAATDLIEA